jgi:hypothetical protein
MSEGEKLLKDIADECPGSSEVFAVLKRRLHTLTMNAE